MSLDRTLFQVDLGSQRFWLYETVEVKRVSAVIPVANSFEFLTSQQSTCTFVAQIAQQLLPIGTLPNILTNVLALLRSDWFADLLRITTCLSIYSTSNLVHFLLRVLAFKVDNPSGTSG